MLAFSFMCRGKTVCLPKLIQAGPSCRILQVLYFGAPVKYRMPLGGSRYGNDEALPQQKHLNKVSFYNFPSRYPFSAAILPHII